MRSHPPALRKLIERTLREECELPNGASLLLGVSGGPDSMALLHVLASLREALGFTLHACGVDHGLRAAAADELALAASFSAGLGVPFARHCVHVPPGGNLHARARVERYRAFELARRDAEADFIVTAHHADDRAETVLLRLLRGSRPDGLAVLPASQGCLLRPMIRARRTQIEAHIVRHAIPFARDPSNLDPRFLRARVRAEVLPLLAQLSPGVVGHLTALADEVAETPLPSVLDESGTELQLNRAQRYELRRALRHRIAGARVLLSGGRMLALDPQTGQPQVLLPSQNVSGADPTTLGPSPQGRAKLRPVGSKRSKRE